MFVDPFFDVFIGYHFCRLFINDLNQVVAEFGFDDVAGLIWLQTKCRIFKRLYQLATPEEVQQPVQGQPIQVWTFDGKRVVMRPEGLREGTRKLLVRTVGEFESLDEIRRLPIGVGGLRLSDVAEVVTPFPSRRRSTF